MRWAGEPDVLLKLEPSSKWLLNAVRIGKHLHIQPHMLLQSSGTAINLLCKPFHGFNMQPPCLL